jgi:hypothetical protein
MAPLCAQVLTVVLSVYVVATLHLAAWIAGMLFTLNTLLVAAGQAPVTLVIRRIPTAMCCAAQQQPR